MRTPSGHEQVLQRVNPMRVAPDASWIIRVDKIIEIRAGTENVLNR